MNIRNAVQNSSIVSPTADNQLMVVTGYTFITLPDTINTFIINLSLSNNTGKYNIPSSVFGNIYHLSFFLLYITFFRFSWTN